MFDADSDHADGSASAEGCMDGHHQCRVHRPPEDAGDMTDLKAFPSDLAKRRKSPIGLPSITGTQTTLKPVSSFVVSRGGADLKFSRENICRSPLKH
ncbi:hypothetical protein ACFPFP_42250 [Bradyrhizobium sp. GCM10023182]|uniref:Uncharacterized protein n=1 Tax=Bradyrhizobium zhengyangense TaxID=2911009 RepID=A0ABS9M2C9_9BRAD|nr:hypothetical protein [Bradyrhizobium zhengyangense]MCG2673432.1 hypothetical protein [Bradyrhizobium zhengyangense]